MKNNQTISNGRGGRRPGAGRKAGARNKRTQAVLDAVKAGGQDPKDFLLEVMRSELPTELQEKLGGNMDMETIKAMMLWYDRRIEAAKAVAPYCHAKLVAIHETTGKKKTFREWLEEREQQEASATAS